MRSAGVVSAVASAVALACAVTTSPFAQKAGEGARVPEPAKTVARLRHVEGNVLVSQETGLASAEQGLRLEDRSRVITTANAKAIVAYDDGCEVTLEPNQRLEIRTETECAERLAQADTIFKEPAGIAFAAAGTGLAGGATAAALAGAAGAGVIGTAGISGLAALLISRQNTAVSPN